MNVLVTGVAGFIGSTLAYSMLERGDTVTGVDNLSDYYAFNNIEVISHNQIKKDGRILYITCMLDEVNGSKWIGTNSGELL